MNLYRKLLFFKAEIIFKIFLTEAASITKYRTGLKSPLSLAKNTTEITATITKNVTNTIQSAHTQLNPC